MSTAPLPWEEAGQNKPPWEEAQAPQQTAKPSQPRGFLQNLWSDIKGIPASLAAPDPLADPRVPDAEKSRIVSQQQSDAAAKNAARTKAHGAGYSWASTAGEMLGVPVAGMEKSAEEGDVGGVLGHAAVVPAMMGAGEVGARVIPKVAPPVIRGMAKGANAALQKAPGTVGAAIGGGIGRFIAGHPGAELGGAAGMIAGRELLPRVRIPGEGFGYPNRIEGGPAVVPPWEPPVSAPPSTPPVATPGAAGSMVDSVVAAPPESAPAVNSPRTNVPTSNMPTPASRAASDAAFARNYPNENFGGDMAPNIQSLWQQSAGFEQPPVDVGTKVRAANPEPTRAEVRAARVQPATPGEAQWPPNFKPSTIQRAPAPPEIATPQDIMETKAIQERVREAAEREDQARLSREKREWFARNGPAHTKGELITARGQTPEVAPPENDLTESWTKALEDLKAKKGKKTSKGE